MKEMLIDGETKYYFEDVRTVRGKPETVKYFADKDEKGNWYAIVPTEDGRMALQRVDANGKRIVPTEKEVIADRQNHEKYVKSLTGKID